jgi:hypothetical protein
MPRGTPDGRIQEQLYGSQVEDLNYVPSMALGFSPINSQGRVMYFDTFSKGLGGFIQEEIGSASQIPIQAVPSPVFSLPYSAEFRAGTNLGDMSLLHRTMNYGKSSYLGIETAFLMANDIGRIQASLDYNPLDGVPYFGQIQYVASTGKWYVYTVIDTGGTKAYVLIHDRGVLAASVRAWIQIKAVMDFESGRYVRAWIGDYQVDISQYRLTPSASSADGHMIAAIRQVSEGAGTAVNAHVGYILFTKDEPLPDMDPLPELPPPPDVVEYLILGGGGGGSNGGGGGGQLLTGTDVLTPGVYNIVVGAGGAGFLVNGTANNGVNGGNSSFNGHSALGGGGGANSTQNGSNGGNGGGSGGANTLKAGGTGDRNGGNNATFTASPFPAGGGAGTLANGGNASAAAVGGVGGAGTSNSITGTPVTYGGGGGAGVFSGGTPGAGGVGGGGNGRNATTGDAGTANTGSGGGGTNNGQTGGAGGSGVVILRMPSVYYSGVTTGSPTVTTDGIYTVIKFTANGSYTRL